MHAGVKIWLGFLMNLLLGLSLLVMAMFVFASEDRIEQTRQGTIPALHR
jgi:hypothetical protein